MSVLLFRDFCSMGCALAGSWYSQQRIRQELKGPRVSASRPFVCDGVFLPNESSLFRLHHVTAVQRITSVVLHHLTANCMLPTLESPIFWMDLLLFTYFDLDLLFALIEIASQSFV